MLGVLSGGFNGIIIHILFLSFPEFNLELYVDKRSNSLRSVLFRLMLSCPESPLWAESSPQRAAMMSSLNVLMHWTGRHSLTQINKLGSPPSVQRLTGPSAFKQQQPGLTGAGVVWLLGPVQVQPVSRQTADGFQGNPNVGLRRLVQLLGMKRNTQKDTCNLHTCINKFTSTFIILARLHDLWRNLENKIMWDVTLRGFVVDWTLLPKHKT